jgi:hypothetical protein
MEEFNRFRLRSPALWIWLVSVFAGAAALVSWSGLGTGTILGFAGIFLAGVGAEMQGHRTGQPWSWQNEGPYTAFEGWAVCTGITIVAGMAAATFIVVTRTNNS